MSLQDTGKFRKNIMDKFYTKVDIAKSCVAKIIELRPQTEEYEWIEPSAGNGSFLKAHSATYAFDTEPESDGIVKQDFLLWCGPVCGKKHIIFGNPPFGRQGSLAKKFIKHSAKFAEIIAFILPRSFTKPSMNNAFPLEFHCIYSEEVEKDSFIVNDISHDVPCVFQIWERQEVIRRKYEKTKEDGFTYSTTDDYDIAFRRVGVNAGKCLLPGTLSKQSHYFLKLEDATNKQKVIDCLNSHEFPSNTTGPRSISKPELNIVLNEILSEMN